MFLTFQISNIQVALTIVFTLTVLCCTSLGFRPYHDPCFGSLCNRGENCVPDRKYCIREPYQCPQYRCVPHESDPCGQVICPLGQRCIPEPKQCFTTPCPQYACVNDAYDPCVEGPCPVGQRCVSKPKQCFTTPCPQYACINDPCMYMKCSAGQTCQNGECKPSLDNTGSSCPPTEGTISNCVFTDCTKSVCDGGLMCCPKACGGTSCQTPI